MTPDQAPALADSDWFAGPTRTDLYANPLTESVIQTRRLPRTGEGGDPRTPIRLFVPLPRPERLRGGRSVRTGLGPAHPTPPAA